MERKIVLRDFLLEKLVSPIKNILCDYVYVNRWRHLFECLITCLRKSISEIGLEFLLFFTFINFFNESIHLRA